MATRKLGPLAGVMAKSIVFARYAGRKLQQFGQKSDDAVWDGKTACTHTCLQFIYQFVFGQSITLNQVNAWAGMPYRATTRLPNGTLAPRGMRPAEVRRFLVRSGLYNRGYRFLGAGYNGTVAPSYSRIGVYAANGPVMYPMRYGSAPEKRGAVYYGTKAKAPYAIEGGTTQLSGFENGRHAVIYLGQRRVYVDGRHVYNQAYRKEPNHGSPVRPEQPPYDVIKTSQAKKEYEDYRNVLGNTLWAVVPTRKVA